ncbi:inositol polyphosphate 5-phosphatase [Onygenales sp. PD_12]|nr:inositol polyphosphate 5-phosphatase [Onygenales sp. PD_12]
MSLRILCRDRPHRTLAVTTEDYALVLRHIPTSTESASTASYSNVISPKCLVEFAPLSSLDQSGYRQIGKGHGTLGLITLGGDVFLCVIRHAMQVATVRPGETVQRIINVGFYCLNRSDYDTDLDYGAKSAYAYSADDDEYGSGYEGRESVTDNPFLALEKLLSDGSFYYSVDFDLTNCLQDRIEEADSFDIESLDKDYLWNSYMIQPLLQFRSHLVESERQTLDSARILTSVIRGFVHSLTIPASTPLLKHVNSNLPSSLTLISRLSSRRAGTRFNSRGIDDDGNVSNFVETETLLWIPADMCFSYTQVRGSIPIFWEQGVAIGSQQKIQVTRSVAAAQPAFNKHFDHLALNYGTVHVVNLLSESKPGEVELSERYRYHISHSPLRHDRDQNTSSEHHLLRATDFDFHAETRGPAGYESASAIRHWIQESAQGFAFFLSTDTPRKDGSTKDPTKSQVIVLQQEGVFRTNCLDCLDRTNLVQTIISQMALELFLMQEGGRVSEDFWRRHSTLWADNGDNLSKIYAGSGALKSSYTRHGKMSLAGAIADIRKSATRLYNNTFTDGAKQNTIDLLLGTLTSQSTVRLFDPINDYVTAELRRRVDEYSSYKNIRIWVGTFNVNGRSDGARGTDLSPWLLPQLDELDEDPSIVAVGFQEIVELSPQQIMSTDAGSRIIWEEAVRDTLNDYAERKGISEYVLLRSGQLVGAALLVFVRADLLPDIKNVEGTVKKTGMSGIAGNKGGCAIRLECSNTRICFVTAHLAAGFTNYDERNRDYQTINNGLRFQRNRKIEHHDTIIWLGDFNYRIGQSDDTVRKLIQVGDFEALYDHDQLNLQMVAGLAFPYYSEGLITFPPTYKYDNGTDQYDTSEKARIPAWCDRVLYKGKNLRQLEYNAAPLKFSDHRPVYATFDCEISVVNERLKENLSVSLYESQRNAVGGSTANSRSEETDDEDAAGYEAIEPGLPPASSDRRKWWLDHGLPAQSTLRPPPDYLLNPRRNLNPFSQDTESEWIYIPPASFIKGKGKMGPDARGAPRPTPPLPPPKSANPLIPLGGSQNEAGSLLDGPLSDVSLIDDEPITPRKQAPPVPIKPASMTMDRSPKPISSIQNRETSATETTDNPHPPRRVMTDENGFNAPNNPRTSPPPVRPRRVKTEKVHPRPPEALPRLPPRPPAPSNGDSSSLLD